MDPTKKDPKPKKSGFKPHLFSLRVKFTLVFTLLILLVMGLVTALILYQVRQTLTEQILNRAEAQATGLASNSSEEMIRLISQSASQTGAEAGADVSIPLMQFAKDAMQAGTGGSAVRDLPTGLAPWEQQGLQASMGLYGTVEQFFWPDEKPASTGDMEYVKILDPSGKEVAGNDIQEVMEHTAWQAPPGTRALGDEPVLTQAYEKAGRTYYDIAAPILSTAEGQKTKVGEVHIGMNQNTIDHVVHYVAVSILVTTLAFVVLGVLLVAILVTVMIVPIRLLVKGVSAIAAGDLDQKIDIRRGDELGDLTLAFNDMAKSLREKELIKGAFSKYVTKSVVDRILQHQDGLKLGGEKKTVTVFFSDIRGFTPMSEALSAEEVVGLLNEYFTAMTAIIFKYEGTLDKFMGDAIMAVFGAPIDQPDHAERAVTAAVEMGEKMKQLQAKWKKEGKREVNIGIGINTGEVVVGNIGSNDRMEYTAIGDNVNLTQRLESVAQKGQILISEATYKLVEGKVKATLLEPLRVKGKSEAVIAYNVEGLKD